MTTPEEPDGGGAPPGRPRLLQGSGAGLAGLLFAVLFVVGFAILDQVPQSATTAELTEFYEGAGGNGLIVAGFYLVPFSGLSFLWFVAASRHRLSSLARREDRLLDTVQLAAGVLFVAMMYVASAAAVTGVSAVRLGGAGAGLVPLEQAATMTAYAQSLLTIYAFRTAGVFIMASTTRALRARLFPRWFAVLSYVAVVVLLLAVTDVRAVVLLVPLWVAAASAVILFRRATGQLEVA
ncbi:hypothetical protein EXU48_06765 [Occultella glacieicola]|uniref:DUF4386 domain-containing protein n=1 Tax=Occultella glacieicola TaxID=2518684 RepID=A0ABY2E5T8_9MICO|nr:hypothetical protein [Occultella glacieicola]TDE95948.1 hypothetical protein EXU48_06765 [Occultella glacieicola]